MTTDDLTEKADALYDAIGTSIFREEFREWFRSVFEEAHAPTDNELWEVARQTFSEHCGEIANKTGDVRCTCGDWTTGPEERQKHRWEKVVDAVAGFRRPVSPELSDDERELIAEADALIEQWDRAGSWTADSPIGLVMRLSRALSRRPVSLGPSTEPRAEAVHRGTFGHVWPCPLFYVGNWRRGEEYYEPTAECSNPAVCEQPEPQGDDYPDAEGLAALREQTEPTDAQVLDALNARELSVRTRSGSAKHFNPAPDLSYYSDGNIVDMRAALRASAETTKSEDESDHG